MLRMPLGQVEPRMILAAPVPNPKQIDYDLLKAGFELTEGMIARLRELGVRTVWVAYPSLEFLDEAVGPRVTAGQQEVYRSLKKNFMSSQQKVVARMDFQEYRRTLNGLVQSIAAQRIDSMIMEPLMAEQADLFAHCSNVCYLALMMGIKLGHYVVQQRSRLDPRHARDVMNLGLGALLHDIGKIELAPEMRNYEPSPTEAPPDEWQRHCERGFEMIRGHIEPSAAQIALNHHQRWDGGGFPAIVTIGRPMHGGQIHVFSRIVAVANWYERLLRLPELAPLPTVAAMKRLRSPEFHGFFDPVVFRAFSDLVPPFPVGSLIGLNDASQAVVLMHNTENPCRPMVRRLAGRIETRDGKVSTSLDGEDIALAEHPELKIVEADGCNVEPYLFEPSEGITQDEPDRILLLAEESPEPAV